MRPKLDRFKLLLALVREPCLNQVFSKYTSFEQKLMVGFECVQNFLQASRCGFDLSFLFRGESVQVLVDGIGRRELLLDPVEPSEQDGAESQIGVRQGSGQRNSTRFAFSLRE